MDAVRKSGIPDYKRVHLRHGIGIEMYDAPYIRAAEGASPVLPGMEADVPLEENMTINIEVPYYELEFGGFQIEYTLVITNTGYEFIVPYIGCGEDEKCRN